MTAVPGAAGFEAEPAEAAAIAAAELAPIADGWPGDLLAQYAAVTSRLVTYQAVTDLIAAQRARIVAEMSAGTSWRKLGALLGMSHERARQLAEAGRGDAGANGRPAA